MITFEISTETIFTTPRAKTAKPEKPKFHAPPIAAELDSPWPTDSQLTLLSELKTMCTAVDDNYPDLKLETKDNSTLSAHKFIVAARSVVLRKLIDGHVKKSIYDGTIKIADINEKPLVIILHWMHTSELHGNADLVMEQLVKASMEYQLTDLLKMLDEQLIKICNPDNMFQLHQVAKKYAMPTAIRETAAYIRG